MTARSSGNFEERNGLTPRQLSWWLQAAVRFTVQPTSNSNRCDKGFMMKLSAQLYVVLMATLFFSGCGPAADPEGTLSGTLTINGKVYEGSVELVVINSKTGKAAVAPVQKDGTFSFSKPLLTGEYTAYLAPSSPPEAKTQAVAVKIDKNIPEEYWNESSPLRVTIEEGKNKSELKIPQ